MSTAEANLDDFFRKRDKKKKSSKSTKYSKIDSAELASHLDAVNSNNNLNDDDQQQVPQQQQQQQLDNETQNEIQINNNDIPSSTTTAATTTTTTTTVIIPTPSQPTKLIQNKLNDLNLNKNDIDDGDEEWKQFESDENKNYSGLKINFIKLRTQESDEENNTEINNELVKKPNCPWLSKTTKTTTTASVVVGQKLNDDDAVDVDNNDNDIIVNNKKKLNDDNNNDTSNNNKTATNVSSAPVPGSYVPPHLRQQQQQKTDKPVNVSQTQASTPSTYVPPHLRNKTTTTTAAAATSTPANDGFQSSNKRSNRNQPNILDECEFPSLSDVKPTSNDVKTNLNTNDNSKFEQPKRSTKLDQQNAPTQIGLENRYNALSS